MTAGLVVDIKKRNRDIPVLWILHEWWSDEMIEENLKIRNYTKNKEITKDGGLCDREKEELNEKILQCDCGENTCPGFSSTELSLKTIKEALSLASMVVCVCESQRELYHPSAPSSVIFVGVPDEIPNKLEELLEEKETINDLLTRNKVKNKKEERIEKIRKEIEVEKILLNKDKSNLFNFSHPFTLLCLGIICPRKNQLWTLQQILTYIEKENLLNQSTDFLSDSSCDTSCDLSTISDSSTLSNYLNSINFNSGITLKIIGARYTRQYEVDYLNKIKREIILAAFKHNLIHLQQGESIDEYIKKQIKEDMNSNNYTTKEEIDEENLNNHFISRILQEIPSSASPTSSINYLHKYIKYQFSPSVIIEIHEVIENVSIFYTSSDALILNSVNEVTPMVICEALSYGLPVISNNIAGIKEMYEDNKEGYLINVNDNNKLYSDFNLLYKSFNFLRIEILKKIYDLFSTNSSLSSIISSLPASLSTSSSSQTFVCSSRIYPIDYYLNLRENARKRYLESFSLTAMVLSYKKLIFEIAPPIILIDMDGVLVDWDKGFRTWWKKRSKIDRTKSYHMEDCVYNDEENENKNNIKKDEIGEKNKIMKKITNSNNKFDYFESPATSRGSLSSLNSLSTNSLSSQNQSSASILDKQIEYQEKQLYQYYQHTISQQDQFKYQQQFQDIYPQSLSQPQLQFQDQEYYLQQQQIFYQQQQKLYQRQSRDFKKYKSLKEEAIDLMNTPGFFYSLPPFKNAIKAIKEMISLGYNIYFCTSPIKNSVTCVEEKILWIRKYFADVESLNDKIIITYNKCLIQGDLLIDDKPYYLNTTKSWRQVLMDAPYNQYCGCCCHNVIKEKKSEEENDLNIIKEEIKNNKTDEIQVCFCECPCVSNPLSTNLPRLKEWKNWKEVILPLFDIPYFKFKPDNVTSDEDEEDEEDLDVEGDEISLLYYDEKDFNSNKKKGLDSNISLHSPSKSSGISLPVNSKCKSD